MEDTVQRLETQCLACGDTVYKGYFCDYQCENNFEEKVDSGNVNIGDYDAETFSDYRDGTGDGATDQDLRIRKFFTERIKRDLAKREDSKRIWEDGQMALREAERQTTQVVKNKGRRQLHI